MTKYCPAFHQILAFRKQYRARKQKIGHCDLILTYILFILIILNTKVQLILYTKFQPNVSSGSGEKVDIIGLVIFSNSGHF